MADWLMGAMAPVVAAMQANAGISAPTPTDQAGAKATGYPAFNPETSHRALFQKPAALE